jgi:hypothetical protein
MYKGNKFVESANWYCSMNSWDDTTASCAAPQEPLWNSKWNLNRSFNNNNNNNNNNGLYSYNLLSATSSQQDY